MNLLPVVAFLTILCQCSLTSATIHLVFTVKNLAAQARLKLNLVTMLESLLEHTSKENLHFHVIGDVASQTIAEETLKNLHYPHQIEKLSLEDLAENYAHRVQPLIKHFSSGHNYYKDPLFFLSPILYDILPKTLTRVIMLDIDLRFDDDVQNLETLFDRFEPSQILGIARENQPVYRHLLWSYRHENPQTIVGSPPPFGLTGFNSGVLLLNLERMRENEIYQRYLNNASLIVELREKFRFNHPHLGDQDFYSLLSFEHPELFFILPCQWNRQLCTWWKDKGYEDVWDSYYRCNNEQNISLYHGNCNTPFPTRTTPNERSEL